MRFSPTLSTDNIPSLLDRFLSIIGPEPWLKRYRGIEKQLRENFLLEPFVFERHSIEMRLGHLLDTIERRGLTAINLSDPHTYGLFSFIAPVTLIHDQLNDTGKTRFAGALRDGLNTDRGLAPFRSEIETATHLMHRCFDVTFADAETGGGFDFLATRDDITIEVECKAASGDLGRKIHRRRMIGLSWQLHPVVRRALDFQVGLLVRILLPSRLFGHIEFLRQVVVCVENSIRTGEPLPGPQPCSVDLRRFELAGTPFESSDPSAINATSIRTFLEREIGQSNPHAFVAFRPGRGAVLVLVESRERDQVVGGLMRELKEAAKGQFTKTRPAILAVQFLDLSASDLLSLAASDSSDPARASALQIATNRFFDNPERPHIHTVIYRAQGVLLQHALSTRDTLTRTYQEQGPAHFFQNPNHPLRHDNRYCVFSSSG